MEFQSHKTKIEAYSVFPIEEVQKILREAIENFRVQLISKLKQMMIELKLRRV